MPVYRIPHFDNFVNFYYNNVNIFLYLTFFFIYLVFFGILIISIRYGGGFMNYSNASIKKRQKQLSSHRIRIGTKVLVYIFKIFVIALVVTAVIGTCFVFGAFKGIINTTPEITLNDVTPSQYQTTVYDCKGKQLETLVASGANRIYVTIDEIPEHLQNAFVAIEDSRFYTHNGIDARGIIRAAYIGISNGFHFNQGASTITQQLIKNSVFSVENEDSLNDRIRRKIQEQYLALQLEETTGDKKIILENYLNTINLGNNNLGVQRASLNYFNKDVSELTLSESAVIAAITQLPYYYNPIRHPDNNATRRKKVLDDMLEQNYISQAEYDEAIADDVYSRIQDVQSASTASKAYSYYTDALVQNIMEDLMTQKGYTYTQAYNLVYRGGLSIYSCEDYDLQTMAEKYINDPDSWYGFVQYSISYRFQVRDKFNNLSTYNESSMLQYLRDNYGSNFELLFSSKEEADQYVEEYRDYILEQTDGEIVQGSESLTYTLQPQTSFVMIENNTGEVKVIVGGRGDKTQSMVLNRATSSERQAGSTIKPLVVYSPAIDTAGYSISTVIDDIPFYYSTGQLVKNNDLVYKGYVTVREAIAESRNIPAVKTLDSIGITTGITYLKNYGLTTITDNDYYLPIALGTCSVTNYEMTAAYTTFANGGMYIKPKLYTKVLDHDGNIILDNTALESTRVIKESTAWLMTEALHSVTVSGTLAHRYPDMDSHLYVSAKSGTSQNAFDRWVIGFAGNYTAGIWAGYDSNKEFPEEMGSVYADIWGNILNDANADVTADRPEPPSNIVVAQICLDSGKLAVDGLCDCDPRGSRVVTEYFEAGNEPTEACNVHTKVTICSKSGKIANEYCPESTRKTVIRIIKNVSGIDLEEFTTEDMAYAITEKDMNNMCNEHKKNGATGSGTGGGGNNNNNTTRPSQTEPETRRRPND